MSAICEPAATISGDMPSRPAITPSTAQSASNGRTGPTSRCNLPRSHSLYGRPARRAEFHETPLE
jgi:hypothetical protein